MKVKTKTDIIALLKAYSDRERKIAVLHYELAHSAKASSDEVIEAMALGHGDGEGRPSGHVSDKTLYIALNYQEKVEKLNFDTADEISRQLVELEQEQNRLKYYMSLLDSTQAKTIQFLYIKKMTQKDAEKVLGYSAKTIRKLRDNALDTLVSMYGCVIDKN